MSKIKVIVVDDHALVRKGILQLLSKLDDVEVVAEGSTGEDAVRLAKSMQPDIVLMDLDMPGIGGMEATKRILHASSKKIKVLVVTSFETEPFPSKLLELGASGYISKDASPEELKDAVRAVYKGKRYLNPKIAQLLALQRFDSPVGTAGESPFDTLSPREIQIIHMIIKGEKVMDIAKKLFLSSKTVNSYRYRFFKKLNVKTDVEVTHVAAKYGLVTLDKFSAKAEAEQNTDDI